MYMPACGAGSGQSVKERMHPLLPTFGELPLKIIFLFIFPASMQLGALVNARAVWQQG
jgi:hypothetical protein